MRTYGCSKNFKQNAMNVLEWSRKQDTERNELDVELPDPRSCSLSHMGLGRAIVIVTHGEPERSQSLGRTQA